VRRLYLAVAVSAWSAYSNPGEAGFDVLLATLGVALGLLGPGAWSIDARLFGWKRVEVHRVRVGVSRPLDARAPHRIAAPSERNRSS
jgi:hypothetical protein